MSLKKELTQMIAISAGFIVILLFVFIGGCNHGQRLAAGDLSKLIKTVDTTTVLVHDSVFIPGKTVYIKGPMTVVYDTTREITTYPFTACLDTIVNGGMDTAHIEFYYPPALLLLDLRSRDSVIVHTKEIKVAHNVYKTVIKEDPWWVKPAYFTAGGFIFGTIVYIAKDIIDNKK